MNSTIERKRITKSTVINDYEWTESLVKKFLPEPMLAPNPHYRTASPMKLFYEDEVIAVMQTEDFKIAREKASRRKSAAKKAVETKKVNLVEKMSLLAESIAVDIVPEEELIKNVLEEKEAEIKWRLEKAEEYFERQLHEYGGEYLDDYFEAVEENENFEFHHPSDEVLNRWIVNHIRHNCTSYDQELLEICGKVGHEEAYSEFKKRLLQKIAVVYPAYADECKRQIEGVR